MSRSSLRRPPEDYKKTVAKERIAAETGDEEDEDHEEGGFGWGQYLWNGVVGESGVQRPAGLGIVECTTEKSSTPATRAPSSVTLDPRSDVERCRIGAAGV